MKPFDVIDVEQRSEAWYSARAGRVTGSSAGALLAERKKGTGELAIRRDLRKRLVVERLTGLPIEDGGVKSKSMQHGIETEASAFRAYEARTGQMVKRCGFLVHRDLLAGVSLDGYVGDFSGLVELKCPDSITHLEYLRAGVLPDDYRGQVIHSLWLTGAAWCDFVSFDDRMPPAGQLFRVRVRAEDVDLKAYELLVRMFLTEVEKELEDVSRLMVAA